MRKSPGRPVKTCTGVEGGTVTTQPGGVWGYEHVDIRYRTFGIERVPRVDLPITIAVDCDRP